MIWEYLEDIDVGIYKQIDMEANKDGKDMAYLVVRTCMFRWNPGLGKLHSDNAINSMHNLCNTVFGNLEFLAERIRAANPDMFRTLVTREFRPEIEFDMGP